MKVAIMSDVHANPTALERVLADAEQCGVEQVICAGDVVGYGPYPSETIRILRERNIPTVIGNHDAAVAGNILFRRVEFDFTGYAAALREKSISIPPWMEAD